MQVHYKALIPYNIVSLLLKFGFTDLNQLQALLVNDINQNIVSSYRYRRNIDFFKTEGRVLCKFDVPCK